LYLAYWQKLSGDFSASATAYCQPQMGHISDYRIRSQIDLDLQVSSQIAFGLEFALNYDSWVPQPSVIKTEMIDLTEVTVKPIVMGDGSMEFNSCWL
jgi:hypothetical protein